MIQRLLITLTALALAVAAGMWLFSASPLPSPKAPEAKNSPSTAGTSKAAAVAPSAPAGSTASAPSPAPATSSPLPPLMPVVAAHPGAQFVPKDPSKIPHAPDPIPVPADFLDRIVRGGTASFALPGGGQASGTIEHIERDAHGISTVQGRLDSPQPGSFFFHRESEPGVAGAFFGNARFDKGILAYRLEPIGPDGSTMLVPRHIDDVICVGMPPPPEDPVAASAAPANGDAAAAVENSEPPQYAPQTHPTNIPIPAAQHNIIPLQSLPGATGVIFLDFEGGPGPWTGWTPSNFAAAPANVTNAQIKEVWQRVAEDYQPFNLNVTTDRSVFEAAPKNSRQRVMVTPTNTVAPTAGGVAFGGSFDSSSDSVCWAFYTTGKNAAEVISHEVGHTLDLAHDGRQVPGEEKEEYYGGHGDGDTGWAPIMGVGYSKVLTQWSKGEYAYATNTQDDLKILSNNNNNVAYRTDDYGDTLATAGYLEILANNTVSNEGIIERNTDVDAFRFQSTGGSVSLTATRVTSGPNLDIEASIYDSSNTLVTSSNPADSLSATVTATLPAGEYTFRVKGVGKGADATTGYTNYATLGAYLITGTAAGGVKPDRFSIPENSANGTAVGSVGARTNHGGQPLGYAIASGNANGAFAVDASTGALTVANASALNYETLSTRWDVPAVIPLFVSITDAANPSLNETIRVVVTVTDVNEAPTITGGAQTIFSRTRIGTKLSTVTASDPDRFDFPTFSIVGGNTNGFFAIDPASGQLSIAGTINVSATTTYPLTIRATDQLSPAKTTDATYTITVRPLAAQYTPGAITLTYYESITGNALTNLTGNAKFPDNPDSLETVTSQLENVGHGDNYGAAFRGYLLIPTTGDYTFRVAADDSAALIISTTSDPANNLQRTSVSSATGYHVYGGSATITNLGGGTVRYIEVRHKEGVGDDYITIAWEGPGIPLQPIPAAYLVPFPKNYAPKISASALSIRENALPGTTIGTPNASDINEGDTLSYAITGGTGAGRFAIDSSTGRISLINASGLASGGSYTLQVQATDNGSPALSASATITVSVSSATGIAINGIARQIWNNFTGNLDQFNSIPGYPYAPHETQIMTSFDAGAGTRLNYASRIRAYVIPPTTGAYQFYIASDNSSYLRFSSNENPVTTLIASVSGSVNRFTYTTQASQTSAVKNLVAGQRYYIEIFQRQDTGSEHLSVAWTGPDITTPTVIPGSALQPFDINAAPTWTGTPYSFTIATSATNGSAVGSVSATDPEGGVLTYAILSGNSSGAFAINASTGAITIANSSALPANQTVTLSVSAQDDGIGGVYPLKSIATTVSIKVDGPLEQWRQQKFGANAANASIAGDSADPDRDGLSNLIEYALGLEPQQAGLSGLLTDTVTTGGQTYLRLTATKNPAATDVAFTIESTGDPATPESWSNANTTVEVNTSTSLRARDNTPFSSAPGRFLRLKVTRP